MRLVFIIWQLLSLDENGAEIGKERFLTDEDQLLGQGIRNVLSSIDHLALQQAKLGAQMSKSMKFKRCASEQEVSSDQEIYLQWEMLTWQSLLQNCSHSLQTVMLLSRLLQKLASKACLIIFADLTLLR